MRRRYVHVDRGDGIKRANRGNRIRRELLPSMSWVSWLCLSRLRLRRLSMDAQRKVHRHRDQPERRNDNTQPNAGRNP